MSNIKILGNNYLDAYIEGNNKHTTISMSNSLINFMNIDSINKIEAQKWSGLDGEIKNQSLKDLLYRSDFITARQRIASFYNESGVVALSIIEYNGKPYLKYVKPIYWKEVMRDIIEIRVQEEVQTNTTEQQIDSYTIWRYGQKKEKISFEGKLVNIDGRVIKERVTEYYDDKGKVRTSETKKSIFVYDKKYTKIPVMLIGNNAERTPDWIGVVDMLKEMNLLADDIGKEWENIKTTWGANGIFGNGKKLSTFIENLQNGKRGDESNNQNSKMGIEIAPTMSGSNSLEILIRTVAFLEDKILKYSFQGRDTTGTGTNKHGSEISLFNQAHSEYIVRKKEQRERDHFRFFKEIVEPILKIGSPKKINIHNSAYEQGKQDTMRLIKAQGDHFFGTASSQKARAKVDLKLAEQTPAQEPSKTQNKQIVK